MYRWRFVIFSLPRASSMKKKKKKKKLLSLYFIVYFWDEFVFFFHVLLLNGESISNQKSRLTAISAKKCTVTLNLKNNLLQGNPRSQKRTWCPQSISSGQRDTINFEPWTKHWWDQLFRWPPKGLYPPPGGGSEVVRAAECRLIKVYHNAYEKNF